MSRSWSAASPFVGITVFALAVFALLESMSPHFFVWDDNATYYLPTYIHSARAVAEQGEPAHLNRFQYLATSHLGSGQPAALYPPVHVAVAAGHRLGDVRWAIDLLFLFHWLASGFGVLCLLRGLGIERGPATGASILWLSFPFLLITGRSWLVVVYTATFSAWSLYLLLRLVRRGGWPEALALAVLKTLFFFAGYPQFFVLSAIFESVLLAAYVACHEDARGRWRHWSGRLLTAAGLTAAWATPLLLPLRHLQVASARRSGPITKEHFLANALDPLDLLKALAFRFRPDVVFEASSAMFYLCPLLLVIVIYGLGRQDAVRRLPWLLTATATFLAATPLWHVFYGVPLLSFFGWPFKSFLFVGLYLTPLAAWGLQKLWRRTPRWTALLVAACAAAQLAVAASPETAKPFSPARVDQAMTVGKHPLKPWMSEEGRVATLVRAGGRVPTFDDRRALLAYQFPTLVERPHLAGYDALVGKRQHDISRSAMFGIAVAFPETSYADLAEDYGGWGVRYLLTPVDGELRRLLVSSGRFEYLASAEGGSLFRNLAYRPVVENLVPGRPSPTHRWLANSVVLESDGPPALFRVAVAEIDGWTWSLDGETQGRPALSPFGGFQMAVPPGRHAVELRYETPGFSTGLGIAGAATALFLIAVLWRRRRA